MRAREAMGDTTEGTEGQGVQVGTAGRTDRGAMEGEGGMEALGTVEVTGEVMGQAGDMAVATGEVWAWLGTALAWAEGMAAAWAMGRVRDTALG